MELRVKPEAEGECIQTSHLIVALHKSTFFMKGKNIHSILPSFLSFIKTSFSEIFPEDLQTEAVAGMWKVMDFFANTEV